MIRDEDAENFGEIDISNLGNIKPAPEGWQCPGVYVKETDLSEHIEVVDQEALALVGTSTNGPVSEPVVISVTTEKVRKIMARYDGKRLPGRASKQMARLLSTALKEQLPEHLARFGMPQVTTARIAGDGSNESSTFTETCTGSSD